MPRSPRRITCMDLEAIQLALRDAGHDGWLFYDHHHRDPIAAHILGLDEKAHITRRWYYYVPAHGEPRKLVHRVEQTRLDSLPRSKGLYSSWLELAAGLEAMLGGATTIAMQYSPDNAIMYVSMVDAGTVEFLRGLGKLARGFQAVFGRLINLIARLAKRLAGFVAELADFVRGLVRRVSHRFLRVVCHSMYVCHLLILLRAGMFER